MVQLVLGYGYNDQATISCQLFAMAVRLGLFYEDDTIKANPYLTNGP